MKLTSNLRLKFVLRNNVISVTTRTYEKASFDQYLAASIAQRCETAGSADEYIDSVTGKGSMNQHLKKLVREMRKRTTKERTQILESSLYPIEKIDDSQSFSFLPGFEVSMIDGKLYYGDLASQLEVLEKIVPYDGELVSMKVKPDEPKEYINNYRVHIEGDDVDIQISPSSSLMVSSNQFKEMVVQDISVPDDIKAITIENIEGDGWLLLTASQINGPMRSSMGFYEGQAYYLVTNDFVKKTEVGYAFGLYFYRESQVRFNPANAAICTLAAKHLLASKTINNYKTNSLINLLGASEGDTAQKCINFVLSIKDSRELASLGLALFASGLKGGWTERSLRQMKSVANPTQLEKIYAISSDIFELKDLLDMDRSILTKEHFEMVEKYQKERESKIEYIQSIVGEVASSALREKSGKLKNDEDVKLFRSLIIKILAHTKVAVKDLNDDALDSRFRTAKRLKSLVPVIEEKIKEQGVN